MNFRQSKRDPQIQTQTVRPAVRLSVPCILTYRKPAVNLCGNALFVFCIYNKFPILPFYLKDKRMRFCPVRVRN